MNERDVQDALVALAARTGGPMTHAQLRALGLSPRAIARRIANGRLTVAFRGVYTLGGPLDLRGRLSAAHMAAGAASAASHWSSLALLGVADHPGDACHVSVRGGRAPRTRPGIVVHRIAAAPPLIVVRGVPATTAARTLLDVACLAGPARLGRLVDEALVRRLTSEAELARTCAEHRGRRGVAVLAAVLGSGRAAPARSELERRLLAAVTAAELPRPLVNRLVAGHEVDFAWPLQRVIVETDGMAAHGHRRALERDHARDAALATHGWLVLRFTWRQVVGSPAAVAARIAEVLAVRAAA